MGVLVWMAILFGMRGKGVYSYQSRAFLILTPSMIGLALGPYTLGRISDMFEYQGYPPKKAMQTSMVLTFPYC